jgi:hypothetical protein
MSVALPAYPVAFRFIKALPPVSSPRSLTALKKDESDGGSAEWISVCS